ncbi:MAG: penicillin-binding protein activator [Candidatus Neomarinimicrobiota bacterium]
MRNSGTPKPVGLYRTLFVWFCLGISTQIGATGRDIRPEILTQERKSKSTLDPVLRTRSKLLFEKGIEHYNAGRYYSALDIFRRLSGESQAQNAQLSASYLMAMKCHIHVENHADALDLGREFLEKFPASSYTGYVHECFGDILVKKRRYASAARSYLDARIESESEFRVNRLDKKLKHLAEGFLKNEEIDDLLIFETDLANRSILTLMMASALLAEGNSNSVALALLRMDLEVLPPSFREIYESLRKRIYVQSRESVVVGAVLPLTGYDEEMGRAFLDGLQAAVEVMKERMSRSIILEIMDNGGDNLRTASSVKTLAANPNVVAIVGPISSVNAVTASAALQQSGVPLLIPVSPQVGLSMSGHNVFQMNSDLHKQGRYVAEYAVRSLGLDRLAVVAPADRFGKGLADGFVGRGDELGAKIVAVEWYSGIPVNLSKQFDSLRKIAFELLALEPDTSGRDFRLDSLDNIFVITEKDFFPDESSSGEELTPADSSEIALSSIDAIYFPIHLGDINYVASQFSTYNLDALLLGNTNWYEPEVLGQQLIGPNVEGLTILVDYVDNNRQRVEGPEGPSTFGARDRDAHKMAVSAYDIMTFLAGQFGDDPDRANVLENLSHSDSFRGTAKVFSFTDTPPRVNSSALVLEYRDGRFIEVGQFDSDSLLSNGLQSP